MENLDILIYSIIVVIFFVSFGISTFSEFRRMNTHEYTGHERSDDMKIFNDFIAKIFS